MNSMFAIDPVFGFEVPDSCPGVPDSVLNPRESWGDKVEFDKQAARLAAMFHDNFTTYRDDVPEAVRAAGPVN